MRTAMEYPDNQPPFDVMRKLKAEAAIREQRIKETIKRIIADAKGDKKPDH